jgi:hypothetical protein
MVDSGSTASGGHDLGQELVFFGEGHSWSPPIRKIKSVRTLPSSLALTTPTTRTAGKTMQM